MDSLQMRSLKATLKQLEEDAVKAKERNTRLLRAGTQLAADMTVEDSPAAVALAEAKVMLFSFTVQSAFVVLELYIHHMRAQRPGAVAPCSAHVACVPRLQLHQSFSYTLLSQSPRSVES